MALGQILSPSPMETSSVDLMNALRNLMEIGKFSDLTIVCGDRRWAVHRALLCSRSRFFEGALSNPFREAETGIIDLSEDDPEAINHMINYFYHNDYLAPPTRRRAKHTRSVSSVSLSHSSASSSSSRPMSPVSSSSSTFSSLAPKRKVNLAMVEDPLLAMAADNLPKPSESPYLSRFGPTSPLAPPDSVLFSVKEPAEPPPIIDTFIEEDMLGDFFNEEMEIPEQEPILSHAHLVTHAKVYAIAEQYDVKPLKELARKKYLAQIPFHHDSSEFAQSLPEIYDSTIESDRGLRDAVIGTFRRFPEIVQRRDIESVVKDTPQLAWELFRVGWGLPI